MKYAIAFLLFLAFPANADEMKNGDRRGAFWVCNSVETMESLVGVAMDNDIVGFRNAVIALSQASDPICMVFQSPMPFKLVEHHFDFVDDDPSFNVEMWSVRLGILRGYTFFGTKAAPST